MPARPVDQLLLGLRGPDEPDRAAQHRGRGRRAVVEQLEQPEQGGRRVADGQHRAAEPVRPQLHAAAERVVPVRAASSAALRSATSETTSLSAGSRDAGDPRGDHRRVAQHRRARGQRGMGAGDDVVGERDVLGDVDLPAGVDQPDHDPRDVGGEPRAGRPRRGSSRTTGGRSRRRRGCSRAPAHPTGGVRAAGIRLRWRPAPDRAAGLPHARSQPTKWRCAAPSADRRAPRRRPPERRRPSAAQPGLPVHALTASHGELSSNTSPIGASTRNADVGDTLVEIARPAPNATA